MKRPIKLKNGEKVWLIDLYEECNQLYFNGKLRKCRLYTYHGEQSVGMFMAKRYKNYKNGYPILLSIGIAHNVDWTIDELRNTLVHEMVHLYLNCLPNPPKRQHGKEFKAVCKELEDKYGLTLRGRLKKLDFNDIQKPTNPFSYVKYWIKRYIL